MNGGQFLTAGASGDEFGIALRGYKANSTGAQGVGGPGEVENAEAESHYKEHNCHRGGRKGGDAQLFGQCDAQHRGGARGNDIQNHGSIQEDGGHQEF